MTVFTLLQEGEKWVNTSRDVSILRVEEINFKVDRRCPGRYKYKKKSWNVRLLSSLLN